MTVTRAGVAGILFAAALFAQESAPVDYKTARQTEIATLVPKLRELANWASGVQLFRERDRINALIISLDPDNPQARTALQYKRKPDGSWSRPPDWKEAKNSAERPLGDLATRRGAIGDPVADRLLTALDRQKATMPAAERKTWFDELLMIAPDSARLHETLGDQRLGERWVLPETATAMLRKPEIAKALAALRDEKRKIEDGKPTDFEAALKLKWALVRQTMHVRLASTLTQPEVDKVLLDCDTTWRLTHRMIGIEPDLTRPFSIILLKNADEVMTYMRAHPETPEEFKAQSFHNFTLGISGNVVAGEERPAERLHSQRQRLSAMAAEWGPKSGLLPAWLNESVGVYVEQVMTGGFCPYYGERNGAPGLTEYLKRAQPPKGNFFEAAAALVKEPKSPSLARVITLDFNDMSPLDSMVLGAFAAYMIEGRPKDVVAFILGIGDKPKEAAAVMKATLGKDVAEIDARFRRWLDETATLLLPAKDK